MSELIKPHRPLIFQSGELPKCQLVEQDVCPESFDDKDLPTDVHLICYSIGEKRYHDAVRAYTKVDIFDAYYDKLAGNGTIHSIHSGFGRVKPKLYGKIKTGVGCESDD